MKVTHDKARGRLVITANNEERANLADAHRRNGYYGAEGEMAEYLHEAYEFVAPEYVPGAMTDAPILVDADDVMHPDNGETVITLNAKVFWFPNYMVEDPWQTLRSRGRVEFIEADSDDPEAPLPPLVPADWADYMKGGEREGQLFLLGGEFAPVADLPEPLRDLYDPHRDQVDPGLYFISRAGKLKGPYAPAAGGEMNAVKAGAVDPWTVREREKREPQQAELFQPGA